MTVWNPIGLLVKIYLALGWGEARNSLIFTCFKTKRYKKSSCVTARGLPRQRKITRSPVRGGSTPCPGWVTPAPLAGLGGPPPRPQTN